MPEPYQIVRVFAKPDEAQGSQALVFYAGNQIDLQYELDKISTELYEQKGLETTCIITQVTSMHYDIHCFNGKKAIQCCGHGMIAAAKTIFSSCDLSSIIINKSITASHTIDEAGHDVVVLGLPRLSARLDTVPGWVEEIITIGNKKLLPGKAAFSDKDDGYLLLEFSPELSLDVFHAMQINFKQVCENTKRAIVVVQFDQDNEHLYMRYFAPQYGVLEDTATGSVMRFVADYVEKNYQCKHFDVSQCSAKGGFMRIDCKEESILITANATMVSD